MSYPYEYAVDDFEIAIGDAESNGLTEAAIREAFEEALLNVGVVTVFVAGVRPGE